MAQELSYAEDVRLNYDPEKPQARFLAAAPHPTPASSSARLPEAVPWPAGSQPTPKPISSTRSDSDSLSQFAGYDAIVMTYTSAEAAALAALFSPGYPVASWYEYRYDIADYIPIVTGKLAPFNATNPEDARYYHSLGLYFPCTIGKARVLLVKSGLHLDYDGIGAGNVIPFNKMVTQMVQTVKPKMFITTGTGGGIGSEVQLGDVILAEHTQFHCVTQFKSQPWNAASYATTPVSAKALALITPALTEVNGAKIAKASPIAGRAVPTIWSAAAATIVTTDFFGFDTSSDYYKLQGLGQACDMGDAMVGQVMQQFPKIAWHAIRNASDPQIPQPAGTTLEQANKEAGDIYQEYGAFTTAASVIASWAVIDAAFNG
jgi:nucleoside phosphorylase